MTTAKNTGKPWTEAESMFGRKTGTHTHPATHPDWLAFTDGNCVVCGRSEPGRAESQELNRMINTLIMRGVGATEATAEATRQLAIIERERRG